MMKNMEWGAVAFLTNSKYGRCMGNSCTEVRINNSESYITGMSAKNIPICGYTNSNENCNQYETTGIESNGTYINNYNNPSSVTSSTTNNYYGIYDMAGNAWEYVMGIMQGADNNGMPASGESSSRNSGFKGLYGNCKENGATSSNSIQCNNNIANTSGSDWPSNKYYDLYDYSTNNKEYQKGILGDATKELGPFYSVSYPKTTGTSPGRYVGSYNADLGDFINSGAPWFGRGGAYLEGSDTGVFAFRCHYGSASNGYSFRVVITP